MRKSLTALSLCALLVVLSGCGSRQTTKTASSPFQEQEVVIPVEAELPIIGAISAYSERISRVEAENHVEVQSEGLGRCELVLVEEGDFVSQGQVLAELDKKEARASLKQAEAQYQKQRVDFERAKQGLEWGITSPAEYDAARFTYEQGLENIKLQTKQLENMTIRAPIGGLLTVRNIQEGVLVNSGSPIFTIVDPSTYMLEINPPESELPNLRIGQLAEVSMDALGGRVFEAYVRRINPSIDVATGTIKVLLDFDAEARKHLREGMYARVKLVLDTHESALLIPKDAVIEENARKFVFVVRDSVEGVSPADSDIIDRASADEAERGAEHLAVAAPLEKSVSKKGTAERVEIETGLEDESYFEVIRGIDETSLVITLGQHTLRSGSEVTVTNAERLLDERSGMSLDEALEEARAKREGEESSSKRR